MRQTYVVIEELGQTQDIDGKLSLDVQTLKSQGRTHRQVSFQCRENFSCASANDGMFFIGGQGGQDNHEINKINIPGMTWTEFPPMRIHRQLALATVSDGFLYVRGGQTCYNSII